MIATQRSYPITNLYNTPPWLLEVGSSEHGTHLVEMTLLNKLKWLPSIIYRENVPLPSTGIKSKRSESMGTAKSSPLVQIQKQTLTAGINQGMSTKISGAAPNYARQKHSPYFLTFVSDQRPKE